MFCNRFINGVKERTHALSVTNSLRSSNEKALLGFESTGASDSWGNRLILILTRTKSGKEAEKNMQSKDLIGEGTKDLQKAEDKCLWYRMTGCMPQICLCVFIRRWLKRRGSLYVSLGWAF